MLYMWADQFCVSKHVYFWKVGTHALNGCCSVTTFIVPLRSAHTKTHVKGMWLLLLSKHQSSQSSYNFTHQQPLLCLNCTGESAQQQCTNLQVNTLIVCLCNYHTCDDTLSVRLVERLCECFETSEVPSLAGSCTSLESIPLRLLQSVSEWPRCFKSVSWHK